MNYLYKVGDLMKQIVFFDLEVNRKEKIVDIGAISNSDEVFNVLDIDSFHSFINEYKYVCGHNIFNHDLKYIDIDHNKILIDTLLWSPLLYPEKPYHHLLKNDKWADTDTNNPVVDAKKSRDLFNTLVDAFNKLDHTMKSIYYELLRDDRRYYGLFDYLEYDIGLDDISLTIKEYFNEYICSNADIDKMIENSPVELAYALSIIKYTSNSILPPWVAFEYPETTNILHKLKSVRCVEGCEYCNYFLDEYVGLKDFFNYDSFRTFSGKDIQRKAVVDAVNQESLLVVFPTGGGKSLTFQLPALMQGRNEGGLTVVISPLQALMKDQIDGLESKSIANAVTINGLLGPVERKKAFEYLQDGTAHILYISPEMLRSRSIENVLINRNVVRFVIDEAHCFSTWGQDFRVDYQYIAKFINKLNKVKDTSIPVSCFTATAKPQVVEDIKEYFKKHLNIEFKEYIYSGSRENLTYHVMPVEDDKERYEKLRNILNYTKEPTIIYASKTSMTEKLSERLNKDGFPSTYFHGQLESDEKVHNQELFMSGNVNIIVATTAFGMGVDKDDVKNVIHYNISSSLENYIQEAGRAGRNPKMQANCYILYNEEDLNIHFNLLNQSRITDTEINQVWAAIKSLTRNNKPLRITPLELAIQSGWKEDGMDVANRIMTSINELERADFIVRKQNDPTIYGNSLRVNSIMEAWNLVKGSSNLVDNIDLTNAVISRMLTVKYINRNDPMARVDLLAIQLGVEKEKIFKIITWLKEVGVIEDNSDIKSYIGNEGERKLLTNLKNIKAIEEYLYEIIGLEFTVVEYKKIVEHFLSNESKHKVNINQIVSLINFLTQEEYLEKGKSIKRFSYKFAWKKHVEIIKKERDQHYDIAFKVIEYLYEQAAKIRTEGQKEVTVTFSFKDIQNHYAGDLFSNKINYETIETVLQFLTKNQIVRIDSAFFVLYNAIRLEKLIQEPRVIYKATDYTYLNDHYIHRNQQIHIIGEYAKLMMEDEEKGNQFAYDYFNISFNDFLDKYFKNRKRQLFISQTLNRYNKIFDDLSLKQKEIIEDESQYVTVFAGPGSGKTRLLVHKLASLALLEKVKVEQILALTFSNAAAVEFKTRLKELIGDIAYFVEVSTFHSYCFRLLEITGDITKSDSVVAEATEKIINNEVDKSKITRMILVIDEAQDMSVDEFNLVKALMEANPLMKILAVGDSDQNIYEFRKSFSKYFESLHFEYGATMHELVTNYRSKKNLIEYTNKFVKRLEQRVKKNQIEPYQNDEGLIEVTKYINTDDLVMPITSDVLSKNLEGSIAILTRENIQALNIYTQLTKNGINAKLLQAEVNYRLYDLYELRRFQSYFNGDIITDEEWELGIIKFKENFRKSSLLNSCLKLLNDFREVNEILYVSDLTQFLYESKEEDFYQNEKNEVVVSTMHQSKGKEFDNVFIYNNARTLNQEESRLLYVAMTRAKNNLFIHTTTDVFDNYKASGLKYTLDQNIYGLPDELVIPLNHSEVQLGVFKSRQRDIIRLRAGQSLEVKDYSFIANRRTIGYFSNNFRKFIDKKMEEGYYIKSAKVNYLVHWFDQEDEQEYLIVLPTITLKKNSSED